jgi:hypothetical protein
MPLERSESRKCTEPKLVELFLSYIVADLDPDDQEKIEKHLPECVRCQDDMKFFLELWNVGRERFRHKQSDRIPQ